MLIQYNFDLCITKANSTGRSLKKNTIFSKALETRCCFARPYWFVADERYSSYKYLTPYNTSSFQYPSKCVPFIDILSFSNGFLRKLIFFFVIQVFKRNSANLLCLACFIRIILDNPKGCYVFLKCTLYLYKCFQKTFRIFPLA